MDLGTFSICLAVKDLQVSKRFYEKLGFTASNPDPEHKNWYALTNGDTKIAIFQGIFDKNTLCFNPGGGFGKPLTNFTDIREIHKDLKAKGLKMTEEEGFSSEKGPAGFFLTDPDGNPILIEQHI